MYHVGRPGEDGYTERVLASWGVDGHNSHTNICSSGGRAGYQFWMGTDRPSPGPRERQGDLPDQLAPGVRSLLQPARAAHHRGQGERREAHRVGHPVVQHRHARRLLAVAVSGQRSRDQPGHRATPHLTSRYNREFVRQWWNWEEYLQTCRPELPPDFASFEADAGKRCTTSSPSTTPRRSPASTPQRWKRSPRRSQARAPGSPSHNWRSAAASNLGGWQVSRTLVLISALARRHRHRGWAVRQLLEQVRAQADSHPASPAVWKELTWPMRVPARAERDVVPAAALSQGGPRQARHLLHPRLQPGVDQPRRLLVDRGAHRRGEGGLLRRVDADVE